MFGSRSLQLDERRQASRRSFEAWILTSRKVFSEESEWKSESSYCLLKSEDNGSGKMTAHKGIVSGVVTDVHHLESQKYSWKGLRPMFSVVGLKQLSREGAILPSSHYYADGKVKKEFSCYQEDVLRV
ncbi:uncharacterized protein TNCV_649141 [Trichonephila clavipes]|nr:uncharacterized protein TNCV_649141 [Trichonephila clavipes]